MKMLSRGVMAAIAVGLASSAAAQDTPVALKFSHWVPPTHPMHAAAVAWAASIERASNGSIKIALFPAQQLGKAFDHYNMARDGIVDISHVNPGYEPGRFPIVGAAELPFIFANGKEGSAALDSWYRRYAGQEMKDVHYCLSFAHDPGTLHFTRKKVVLPADMSGLKVRPPNAVIANWMTLLGATNVQAAAPEIRDVLERGVADAAGSPWGSMLLFGIEKVTKYHIDSALYVSEQVWVPTRANMLRCRRRKEGDGRALHQRLGAEDCGTVGRFRVGRPRQNQGDARAGCLSAQPDERAPPGGSPRSRSPAIGKPRFAEPARIRRLFDDLRKTLADYKSGY
jgi:TRAP-type C4-dicarboxylate transport system substrate-binding protein